MAKLETAHTFEGGAEKVFSGIQQYHLYPEYLPGVTDIEVLPAKVDGSSCQVKYHLHLIKKFYYTLDMFEEGPSKIWWSLSESNIMKSNDGSWQLTEAKGGNKTKAVYSLDIKFRGLVPSAITDQIAKANLPNMMVGFQRIIDNS